MSVKEFRGYQTKYFESLLSNFDSFVSKATGTEKLFIFQAVPLLSLTRQNPDTN